MNTDKIKKDLQTRFDTPLPDFYVRRIIFWKDPDKEFENIADELVLENVKIIKLTGCNNFAVKMLLSETDTTSNYLVYDPIVYNDIRDNWLLDIELYSESFSADLISMRLHELNMPPDPRFRKALKMYGRFFENKERTAKLRSFANDYSSVGQLHIDILAVLTGSNFNTVQSVIGALLMNGLDEENTALDNIRKFGNEAILWEIINRYTGYAHVDGAKLIELAAHILITALSVTVDTDKIRGIERYISKNHMQACYAFVNEWIHSSNDDELYDIAVRVEEMLSLPEKFDKLDVSELLGSECFPCINECILSRFMTEISEHMIKPEVITEAVEKRRTFKWYKHVRYYFDGLLNVAKMQNFLQNNFSEFHHAEHTKLWKEYSENYYLVDTYYREFHAAFNKSLKFSNAVIGDLYKNVADYVEGLYKNRFLCQLGSKWTSLTEEYFMESAALPGIPQQTNFYKDYIAKASNSGRIYVIISDALRFEVAAELCKQLTQTTKGTAEINAVQSVFPSATKFGMAALLPHERLTLTDDLQVRCDGMSTEGTAARDKILKSVATENIAVSYNTFIKMKMSERRNMTNGASVVYIYHNSIDAVGDKQNTEDRVFSACETTLEEIKNLVRIITNELTGSNILITADHGFLYSYKPLEETDKAEKAYINGEILELDKRYAVARNITMAEHMIKIPMAHFESDFVGLTPYENIRIKKSGGGINYVHGGISLQELTVPVIVFKNFKTTSKKFVETKKAELLLVTQSRKITNSIFSLDFYQQAPVGGKIQPATYEIFIADEKGVAVSDKKIIIADKTDDDAADRVFRLRFALKSMDFSKTAAYYLTIIEKDSAAVSAEVEFSIDIAFINEFDF